jgi:hypothetical protein
MKRADLLAWAIGVVQEYHARGWALTLRQLYYQGVTREVFDSGDKSYKRLMDTITTARESGEFPLWGLVDRTRRVHPARSTRNDANVDRALLRAAQQIRDLPDALLVRDRWFGQENHVSVWFEKEALAGVFEHVCADLGVSWFSARGDPSQPALYEWLTRAAVAHGVENPQGFISSDGCKHKGMAKRSVVLYFGDHDPTGIRIPRTAERTVRHFQGLMGLDFPIEFQRVGITLEQATKLKLPPFPAKEASVDYEDYVAEFNTTDAWELDALGPDGLDALVREAVVPLWDAALSAKLQRDVASKRAEMQARMTLQWLSAAVQSED